MIVFKQYNDTYMTLLDVVPDIYKKHEYRHKLKNYNYSPEEIERIKASRRKRRIKEIALCNDFQWFGTFTISSKINYCNRYDLEECAIVLKQKFKAYKRIYNDFKFVYVFEEHKDKAYHLHGLFSGFGDLYLNKYGYLSSKFFDDLGFNSFSKIRDYNKACNYITKYISKNPVILESGYVYNCSRFLKKPTFDIMIDEDFDKLFGNRDIYENGVKVGEEPDYYIGEYCKKKDFCLDTLTNKQAYNLRAYFAKNNEVLQQDDNYITNWLKLFTNLDIRNKIQIHN